MEGTLKWNSGNRSGYLEIEELWYKDWGSPSYVIEVGTKLTDDNKLFLYIATYEGDLFHWQWMKYYPQSRRYHTYWVSTKLLLPHDQFLVQIYDCDTEEMMVSKLLETEEIVGVNRLGTAAYALEYDKPRYNANGTIAFQKLNGGNWLDHEFAGHGWLKGYEPHDRIHATIIYDNKQGCGGPGSAAYTIATDGVGGDPPLPLNRPPLRNPTSNGTSPMLAPTPTPVAIVHLPIVTKHGNATRVLFNGWWQ